MNVNIRAAAAAADANITCVWEGEEKRLVLRPGEWNIVSRFATLVSQRYGRQMVVSATASSVKVLKELIVAGSEHL
ncbi:hypothetical protein E2C01_092319 [Portunus trituberculatus]|uniref:Uncharacterized protein n=1 Tax=Portunus trituberculatus TaxID=210409 RepID=A0A5B7JG67_PORTR|nr:hypothetical protein [Portunus trituberculatus]